jgi:hypothetical protein
MDLVTGVGANGNIWVVDGYGPGGANYVDYLTACGGCPTISVGPATVPFGTVGTAYPSTTFTQTGGIGTITWSETGTLPTGMNFSGGVLSGTPTQPGSFPITVTATDANGCTGSQDYTLTIYPEVIATAATADPVSGMAALTLNFTGSATGGDGVYTYDWDFGDGTVHSPAQNPSHTYYAGGNYTVTFTVTDGLGNVATDAHLVINVTQPAVPLLVNSYDDKGRSQCCVNTITGEYQWYIYKGVGAGNTYTGTLQVLNGRTLFKSFPADPQGILYATFDPLNSRARGYHSLGTVYSALADSNTKNNPACGSGGPYIEN